jgi:hypothetical protein
MTARYTSSVIALVAMLALTPRGYPQSGSSTDKHLGVASCASTVCHGKPAAQTDRRVALNEFRIWNDQDLHAQAFRSLGSAQSKQIAAKLGLPSAAGAKICLDCHADNVPAALQGPKFHLSDGVGCEACHGGAEQWIGSHTQKDTPHNANVARGLYPNEQPLRRAELCLSCHLGTRDKFATHMILAAGHPRLIFELESFTADQPPHYKATPAYIARKGKIDGMNLWFSGQLENARRYLTLLQSPLLTPSGMIPEIAFYDCYACHHAKEKMEWSPERAGPGVKPGSLRLQKHSLVILEAALEALGAPGSAAQIKAGTDELIRAGDVDAPTIRAAAQKLLDQLRGLEPWTQRNYSSADIERVRAMLLRYAAEDKAADFSIAEQIVLGVDSLSHSLADQAQRKAPLDALFASVKSGSDFNAADFAEVAKHAQALFPP